MSSAIPEVTSVPNDRDQRAKFIVDRVPFGTGQEAEAESVDGGHAALHQRNDDCYQQRQHTECADTRQAAERQVENCLSFEARFV